MPEYDYIFPNITAGSVARSASAIPHATRNSTPWKFVVRSKL